MMTHTTPTVDRAQPTKARRARFRYDLPIRWQMTLLHAAILTLVLAVSGVLLYTQERSFLIANAAARLRAQAQPTIEARFGAVPEPRPKPPRPPRGPSEDEQPTVALSRPTQEQLAALPAVLQSRDTGVIVRALDGSTLAASSEGPQGPQPNDAVLVNVAAGTTDEYFVGASRADEVVTTFVPVAMDNVTIAMVQLTTPMRPIDEATNRLALYLVIGWVLGVGVATALGVAATRRVLRPLDGVVATTRRIAAGDLRQRVGLPPGRNEIGQLSASFDAMVERLEAQFWAQRRFVADAAHELRTPLTALSASVELLQMNRSAMDDAARERLLRYLDIEISRLNRLTTDLLTLSTLDARPQLLLTPLDMSDLLQAFTDGVRELIQEQTLAVEIEPDLLIAGDADRLQQVFLNVLDNARKYTPKGGSITLTALAVGDHARVTVADTGPGIPADALPQLFDRFYRVDEARTRSSGGSGLGLAIVKALVEAHHGTVEVRSAPGQGTTITLTFPLLGSSEKSQE